MVPSLVQQLISGDGHGGTRAVLMEVACSPDSPLTDAVRAKTGEVPSASRCGLWNASDLSTPEGLRFVLDRIKIERPQQVWITPPTSPFSPMQNINQRSEAQKQALSEKRREAMKIYVGVCCVFHTCMHMGTHCTIEMADRCDAWRLPLFQRLKEKYSLWSSVIRGCRVQLRDEASGRYSGRGWRIMTSHRRLAEQLDLPCRCDKAYKHAPSSGAGPSTKAAYTQDLMRRIAETMCQELSMSAVMRESLGESELPEGFGEGETCTCGEGKLHDFHLTCSNCVSERESLGMVVDEAPGLEAVEAPTSENLDSHSMYSQSQQQQTEAIATELLKAKRWGIQEAEPLLRAVADMKLGNQRSMSRDSTSSYQTFGMYSHGNQYGVTNKTHVLPQVTRYMNQWLKHNLPQGAQWSSFVISKNSRLPVHRDNHNDHSCPNYLLGVGNYGGGELWVETPPGYEGRDACAQVSVDGERLMGRKIPTLGQCIEFSPQAWHCTCPWKGTRLVVSVYVSRGCKVVAGDFREELRKLGFSCPRYPSDTSEKGFVIQRRDLWKRSFTTPGKQMDERIRKQLYLLHSATGHGSTRHMVDALRRRGASARVLELAREFKCSVCQEKRKVGNRQLATLEPLPPRWSTVSADIGHWAHPRTQEQVQFMLIVDECSRFRAARILTRGSKQQPGAQSCLGYLQEGWMQYFGKPQVLRLDPAGSFRSQAVEGFCDRHGIYLEIIPGEAHWKLGVCEQAVKGVKEVMTKMCDHDPEVTPEEALAITIMTFNHRDLVRGFSPVQHALGHNPDQVGPVLETINQAPVAMLWEDPQGEIERSARLRAQAEAAHASWVAQQRIVRAQNSRSQPLLDYQAGELVYLWRSQTGQQGRRQPGDKHGRFIGPARILATEKKRDEQGSLVAGKLSLVGEGPEPHQVLP